jgi:hypothetical protein
MTFDRFYSCYNLLIKNCLRDTIYSFFGVNTKNRPAMKTKLTTILTVFILILLTYSCNKTSSKKANQPEITGKVISQSDCKSHFKGLSASDADSNQSCIVYAYAADSNRLNITHENTGFNCSPGVVTCAISFSNDTITIEEIPEYTVSNCDCLFDLKIALNRTSCRLSGKTGIYDRSSATACR